MQVPFFVLSSDMKKFRFCVGSFLVMLSMGIFVGCSSSETAVSADVNEVETFLKDNPELANADLSPPEDPE